LIDRLIAKRVGVLADDLTGAGDVALAFASAGLKTELGVPAGGLPARPGPGVQVWVLDTESRNVPPRAARGRVRQAIKVLSRWKPDFLFKKIDSTLRGNIAPELAEFLAGVKGVDPVPFVPAFPRMGRAVVNGKLRVNGVPLHRSAFGADPRHPARTDRVSFFLGSSKDRVVVPDIQSHRDLDQWARRALSGGAAVGSAGLAEALAVALKSPRPFRSVFPGGGPKTVGVVVGSAHPLAAKQVDKVRGPCVHVVRAPAVRSDPGRVLRRLVKQARRLEQERKLRRWVMTGGETAFAVVRGWGVGRWRVAGRIERGVPVCVSIEKNPHWIVLKPGGFGTLNCLAKAVRILKGGEGNGFSENFKRMV
jgi:uncharacterized protein YgbK (DUF1537 family)